MTASRHRRLNIHLECGFVIEGAPLVGGEGTKPHAKHDGPCTGSRSLSPPTPLPRSTGGEGSKRV